MVAFTTKLTACVNTVCLVYMLCNCYFFSETHVTEFSPFGPWVCFFMNAPFNVFVVETAAMHISREGCLAGISVFKGAQVCDLVGLYLLHQIDLKFPLLRLGLYRDDGLGVTYSIPGPARERMKKDIIKVFKDNGLSITIDMGPQKVEFLDVILDLSAQNYGPYRKPNSTPRYINVQSNHPQTVLKQIPLSINKRLSKISSSKEKFDSCKNDYLQARDES